MYSHITPSVLATEAVMTLAGFSGVVVFVEGPSDLRIFENFLPAEHFRVVHSVKKDIALAALEYLDSIENIEEQKRKKVVALVDSDFDRVLGITRHPRAFVTDFHDMEVMILWSDAFARWLREYATADKLIQYGGIDAVRNKLLASAVFIGAMRLFSLRSGIGIDFEGLRYDKYLDKRRLSCDEVTFCQSVHGRNRCSLGGYNVNSLKAEVDSELANFCLDERDLVQGHDLLNLLGILMRYALASLDASLCAEVSIAPALRLAYRPEEWNSSNMARSFDEYLRLHGLPSFV